MSSQESPVPCDEGSIDKRQLKKTQSDNCRTPSTTSVEHSNCDDECTGRISGSNNTPVKNQSSPSKSNETSKSRKWSVCFRGLFKKRQKNPVYSKHEDVLEKTGLKCNCTNCRTKFITTEDYQLSCERSEMINLETRLSPPLDSSCLEEYSTHCPSLLNSSPLPVRLTFRLPTDSSSCSPSICSTDNLPSSRPVCSEEYSQLPSQRSLTNCPPSSPSNFSINKPSSPPPVCYTECSPSTPLVFPTACSSDSPPVYSEFSSICPADCLLSPTMIYTTECHPSSVPESISSHSLICSTDFRQSPPQICPSDCWPSPPQSGPTNIALSPPLICPSVCDELTKSLEPDRNSESCKVVKCSICPKPSCELKVSTLFNSINKLGAKCTESCSSTKCMTDNNVPVSSTKTVKSQNSTSICNYPIPSQTSNQYFSLPKDFKLLDAFDDCIDPSDFAKIPKYISSLNIIHSKLSHPLGCPKSCETKPTCSIKTPVSTENLTTKQCKSVCSPEHLTFLESRSSYQHPSPSNHSNSYLIDKTNIADLARPNSYPKLLSSTETVLTSILTESTTTYPKSKSPKSNSESTTTYPKSKSPKSNSPRSSRICSKISDTVCNDSVEIHLSSYANQKSLNYNECPTKTSEQNYPNKITKRSCPILSNSNIRSIDSNPSTCITNLHVPLNKTSLSYCKVPHHISIMKSGSVLEDPNATYSSRILNSPVSSAELPRLISPNETKPICKSEHSDRLTCSSYCPRLLKRSLSQEFANWKCSLNSVIDNVSTEIATINDFTDCPKKSVDPENSKDSPCPMQHLKPSLVFAFGCNDSSHEDCNYNNDSVKTHGVPSCSHLSNSRHSKSRFSKYTCLKCNKPIQECNCKLNVDDKDSSYLYVEAQFKDECSSSKVRIQKYKSKAHTYNDNTQIDDYTCKLDGVAANKSFECSDSHLQPKSAFHKYRCSNCKKPAKDCKCKPNKAYRWNSSKTSSYLKGEGVSKSLSKYKCSDDSDLHISECKYKTITSKDGNCACPSSNYSDSQSVFSKYKCRNDYTPKCSYDSNISDKPYKCKASMATASKKYLGESNYESTISKRKCLKCNKNFDECKYTPKIKYICNKHTSNVLREEQNCSYGNGEHEYKFRDTNGPIDTNTDDCNKSFEKYVCKSHVRSKKKLSCRNSESNTESELSNYRYKAVQQSPPKQMAPFEENKCKAQTKQTFSSEFKMKTFDSKYKRPKLSTKISEDCNTPLQEYVCKPPTKPEQSKYSCKDNAYNLKSNFSKYRCTEWDTSFYQLQRTLLSDDDVRDNKITMNENRKYSHQDNFKIVAEKCQECNKPPDRCKCVAKMKYGSNKPASGYTKCKSAALHDKKTVSQYVNKKPEGDKYKSRMGGSHPVSTRRDSNESNGTCIRMSECLGNTAESESIYSKRTCSNCKEPIQKYNCKAKSDNKDKSKNRNFSFNQSKPLAPRNLLYINCKKSVQKCERIPPHSGSHEYKQKSSFANFTCSVCDNLIQECICKPSKDSIEIENDYDTNFSAKNNKPCNKFIKNNEFLKSDSCNEMCLKYSKSAMKIQHPTCTTESIFKSKTSYEVIKKDSCEVRSSCKKTCNQHQIKPSGPTSTNHFESIKCNIKNNSKQVGRKSCDKSCNSKRKIDDSSKESTKKCGANENLVSKRSHKVMELGRKKKNVPINDCDFYCSQFPHLSLVSEFCTEHSDMTPFIDYCQTTFEKPTGEMSDTSYQLSSEAMPDYLTFYKYHSTSKRTSKSISTSNNMKRYPSKVKNYITPKLSQSLKGRLLSQCTTTDKMTGNFSPITLKCCVSKGKGQNSNTSTFDTPECLQSSNVPKGQIKRCQKYKHAIPEDSLIIDNSCPGAKKHLTKSKCNSFNKIIKDYKNST